jgi:hypothetical protein
MFYLFMTILKGESWIVVTLNGSKERRTNMSKGNKTKVLDLDYSYFLYKSRHHHCIVQLSLQEITKQREISPKIQNPKSTTQSAIINQTSQQSDRGEQIFYGRPLSNNRVNSIRNCIPKINNLKKK